MVNNWYVYALVDPRTGRPFYVGKGRRRRAQWHIKENHGPNAQKKSLIQAIRAEGREPLIVYLYTCLNEQEAFNLEVLEILCYGRKPSGWLTNMNNGGAGQSGFKPTKVTRAKIARAMCGPKNHFFGRRHSAISLAKIGAVNRGKRLGREWRAKLSAALKGRPKSPAYRRKISAALKGKGFTPEHAGKVIEANRRRVGFVTSDKTRALLSAALKGKPKSEKTKAKMKLAWAQRRLAKADLCFFHNGSSLRACSRFVNP
jgi:NUMOD3 motif